MTALDAIGPYEILSWIPESTVYRVAKFPGEISTDSGLKVVTEHGLEGVSQADVLVVPGAGNASTLQHEPKIHEWIRSIHQKTTWATPACIGSLILDAAGILSGVIATTYWAAFDRLEKWGAQPVRKRVAEDGKIFTVAGVSAGIDRAIILTETIAGTSFAHAMQIALERDPEPPFDKVAPAKLLKALQKRMSAEFEN